MNVAETITKKVFRMPPKAQEEVLRQVEQIEERYHRNEDASGSSGYRTDRIQKLETLFKETQALPDVRRLTEDEILHEVEAHRTGR